MNSKHFQITKTVVSFVMAVTLSIALLQAPISVAASEYTLSSEQKDYVDRWFQICIEESVDHNLPWQVPMAQGILESGSGTTQNAVNNHNHHGIKSKKNDGYRYFETDEDGWRGYFNNIEITPVYSRNGIYETFDSPESCIDALVNSGYAEDPAYKEKLTRIVEAIEMYRQERGWPTSAEYAEKIESEAQADWNAKIAAEIKTHRLVSAPLKVEDSCDNAFGTGISYGHHRVWSGSVAIVGGFINVYYSCLKSKGAI